MSIDVEAQHVIIVVLVILCAGLLGGAASLFLERIEASTPQRADQIRTRGMLILGVAASFISPLFLEIFNAGGDSLIFSLFASDPAKKSKFYPYLLLLFAYCCLFAIFAKRFLHSTFDQLLRNVEERVLDKAEGVAERTAQDEVSKQERSLIEDHALELLEEASNSSTLAAALSEKLSPTELEILRSLGRSETQALTTGEVSSAVRSEHENAARDLERLSQLGFVRSVLVDGSVAWKLRARGAAKLRKEFAA